MRRLSVLALVLFHVLRPQAAFAEDWAIRRSEMDPRIIARYKGMLLRNPGNTEALERLVALYRRHRSLAALAALLKREVQEKPDSLAPVLVLGHVQARAGDLVGAAASYRRAIELGPRDPGPVAALAKVLERMGKGDEALKVYEQALALTSIPASRRKLLEALATLATRLQAASAVGYLQQLVALGGGRQVRLDLARAAARGPDRRQAIPLYQQLIKEAVDAGERASLLRDMGDVERAQGDGEAAVRTYRQALALTRRDHWLRPDLMDRIIAVYRDRDDLKSLIVELEKDWTRRGAFEHRILGQLFDETGEVEQALRAYRSALRSMPHDLATHQRLIQLLHRSGRTDEVIEAYGRLIRVAPGDPNLRIELARRLHEAGRQPEAMQLLERCGQQFAGDASVQTALADLYMRWGDAKRALKASESLVRIEPSDPEHIINLGEQHFLAGRKALALQTWNRLLKVIPKRHAALARLAEVLAQHHLEDRAIELYQQAVKLSPNSLEVLRSLALLLEVRRQTTRSLDAWQRVLTLARAAKSRQSMKEARSHIIDISHNSYILRQLITENIKKFENTPPDVEAGLMLVEAYLKIRNLDRAGEVYRRLLELDRDNPDLLNGLVDLYRKQRRLDDAIQVLERLAVVDAANAADYFQQIADLLSQLLRDKEAMAYAHRAAVQAGRKDARALERLGRMYEKQGDYPRAAAAYGEAIAMDPSHLPATFALAQLEAQQGQVQRAEALLRQVLQKTSSPDLVRRAFRQCVDLSTYLGTLEALEKDLLAQLQKTPGQQDLYRELLLDLYRRRIPPLVDIHRRGNPEARAAAREELRRIGRRGLAPLLDQLSRDSQASEDLVRFLGYLENPSAVHPLLAVAEKTEEEVFTIYGARDRRWHYALRHYYAQVPDRFDRSVVVGAKLEAVLSLGRIGSPAAIDGLVRLLRSKEGSLRDAAAWALGRIGGPRVARPLFQALGDARPSVQMMACAGLGRSRDLSMRPVLEEVMLDLERAPAVRAACAFGLGGLGDRAAAPALLQVLGSGDLSAQRLAARALLALADASTIEPLIQEFWRSKEPVQRLLRRTILHVAQGSPIQDPHNLPDVLFQNGRPDLTLFLDRLEELPSEPNPSDLIIPIQKLLTVYKDSFSYIIQDALSRHRDLTLRLLQDLDLSADGATLGLWSEPAMIVGAAEVERHQASLLPILAPSLTRLSALCSHEDEQVRGRAISVLAKTSPQSAADTLRKGLADRSSRVRLAAIRSLPRVLRLGGLGASAVLSLVQPGLRSRSWVEREAAVEVLASLTSPVEATTRAAEHLVRLSRDENAFVRQGALLSLGRLVKAAGPPTVRSLAREAASLGLRDEVPQVRTAARGVLASMQDGRQPRLGTRGDLKARALTGH